MSNCVRSMLYLAQQRQQMLFRAWPLSANLSPTEFIAPFPLSHHSTNMLKSPAFSKEKHLQLSSPATLFFPFLFNFHGHRILQCLPLTGFPYIFQKLLKQSPKYLLSTENKFTFYCYMTTHPSTVVLQKNYHM